MQKVYGAVLFSTVYNGQLYAHPIDSIEIWQSFQSALDHRCSRYFILFRELENSPENISMPLEKS